MYLEIDPLDRWFLLLSVFVGAIIILPAEVPLDMDGDIWGSGGFIEEGVTITHNNRLLLRQFQECLEAIQCHLDEIHHQQSITPIVRNLKHFRMTTRL